MFYKRARVEYVPVGVVGAIVPFNYPFHNVFNPLVAAVFAGNAIVIKVSEHASWSVSYYKRIIDAALAACGAPEGLVQIVTGYGEAGNALVTGGTDKVIFVGSTAVGSKVMAAAAANVTPVVLELGGKDAVVVCDDADYAQAFNHGMRGGFQSNGQNCAGGERYFVHRSLLDRWLRDAVEAVGRLRQGAPVGHGTVDLGAQCLPGLREKIHDLVEDARAKGARVLAGGYLPGGPGQFYPPTVITDVDPSMKIYYEEVFGPVMTVVSAGARSRSRGPPRAPRPAPRRPPPRAPPGCPRRARRSRGRRTRR